MDYSVTWQKLKDVLKVAGKIVSVDLAKDRGGKSKGYASVQFSEQSEAINAIGMYRLCRHDRDFPALNSARDVVDINNLCPHMQ